MIYTLLSFINHILCFQNSLVKGGKAFKICKQYSSQKQMPKLFFTSQIDQKIKTLKTIDPTLKWQQIVEIIGRVTGKYFSKVGVQMRWKKSIIGQKKKYRAAKVYSFEWDDSTIKKFTGLLTSQLNIKSAFKLFVTSVCQENTVELKEITQQANKLIVESIRSLEKMCCQCDNQFKFSIAIPRKTLDNLLHQLHTNKKDKQLKSLQNLLAKIIKYVKFDDKVTKKQIVEGYKLMIHIVESKNLHKQTLENQKYVEKILWSTNQKYKLFQLYQIHKGILVKIVQDLTITGEESVSRFKPRNIRDRIISQIRDGLCRLQIFIEKQKSLLPQQSISLPSAKHVLATSLYGGNLRIGQFSLNEQLIRLNFIQEISKQALIVIIRMIKQLHVIKPLPLDLPIFQDFQKQLNIKIEYDNTNKENAEIIQEQPNMDEYSEHDCEADQQEKKPKKMEKSEPWKRKNRKMFKQLTPLAEVSQSEQSVSIFDQEQD